MNSQSPEVQAAIQACEHGEAMFRMGQFQEASEKFEAALRVAPGHPVLLRSVGLAYWFSGRKREALSTLSQAFLLSPNELDLGRDLIQLYASMGDPQSAKEIAAQLHQRHPEVHEFRAMVDNLEVMINAHRALEAPVENHSQLRGLRILFIAEPASIHSARWVNQFIDLGWDIHVACSVADSRSIRAEFKSATSHINNPTGDHSGLAIVPFPELIPGQEDRALETLIDRIQPDIIHSLGLCINWQNRCLPVAKALKSYDKKKRIPWLYSSWGADLDYFALHMAKRSDILASLDRVDYCLTECDRDMRLARELGFSGQFMGKLPVFGGADWDDKMQAQSSPSCRKKIVIKGRDAEDGDLIGRALTVVHALLACADDCRDYEIVFLQAGPKVVAAATALKNQTGLNIQASTQSLPHATVVDIMSQSRIMISITINDGLPSFLTEAFSMGVFPIHSDLESIREYISSGDNGLLVPHDDVLAITQAIRRALRDDAFVDRAAKKNLDLVKETLSYAPVKAAALDVYAKIRRAQQR